MYIVGTETCDGGCSRALDRHAHPRACGGIQRASRDTQGHASSGCIQGHARET